MSFNFNIGDYMKIINGKVALVTGASSGIGSETVKLLLLKGVKVYATARRVELMSELELLGANILKMDVTNEESMKACVNSILEKEKSIDFLINNAGYGSYGAIEDVPIDEARRQFEVNIFGLSRLVQLVLPKMRENRYGKIVNISSVGGKIYTSFGGWYHATKHALEGLSDCLRLELKEFNIDVIIIEPGGIKTDWGLIASKNLKDTSKNGAYSDSGKKIAESMEKMYSSEKLSHPSVIAKSIVKSVSARKPKTRYVTGSMSKLSLFMRAILTDKMFDLMIKKMI